MKVHFAGIDRRDYITSLSNELSKSGVKPVFSHESFLQKNISKGEIIHIHWPESYFPNWNVVSKRYLKQYVLAIQYYQARNPIVFTLHNLIPHDGKSDMKQQLYAITVKSATIIQHLGPKSIKVINDIYPSSIDKDHQVIPHHIIPIPFKTYSKSAAKRQLSLAKRNKVIFCPGSLRYIDDTRQLWILYENLQYQKNTTLIVHKYRNLLNRYFLVNIFNYPVLSYKEFKYRFLNKRVTFINQSLSFKKLCTYLAASDLILLPRTQNLNSGIPFLTVHFNVPLLVQANGNIEWSLEKLGYNLNNGLYKPQHINKVHFNKTIMDEMISLYQELG